MGSLSSNFVYFKCGCYEGAVSYKYVHGAHSNVKYIASSY